MDIIVIFDEEVPIGFTMSENQAKLICDKTPGLTWTYKTPAGNMGYSDGEFVCSIWTTIRGVEMNVNVKLIRNS